MAGPYGTPDYTITYGSDITAHVTTEFPALDMDNETEEHTPGGQSLVQYLFTGRVNYGEISVAGPFTEDIDAILGAAARDKTDDALVLLFGGTKAVTFSAAGVKNYKRVVANGAVTGYVATFVILFGSTVLEA